MLCSGTFVGTTQTPKDKEGICLPLVSQSSSAEKPVQVLPLVRPSSMTLAEIPSIKQSRRTQNVQTLDIFLAWRACLEVIWQKYTLEAWNWPHTLVPGIGNVRMSQNLDPVEANKTGETVICWSETWFFKEIWLESSERQNIFVQF